MNPERNRSAKNRLIQISAFTTIASGAVIIFRESQRRKAESRRIIEEGNYSSGDFGVIFTRSP